MSEIMNEIYYMLEDQAGQELIKDEDVKSLEDQKSALKEEIAQRIGAGGKEMLETLANLNLELEDIHDKALFRAAVQLGAELVRPEAGVGQSM